MFTEATVEVGTPSAGEPWLSLWLLLAAWGPQLGDVVTWALWVPRLAPPHQLAPEPPLPFLLPSPALSVSSRINEVGSRNCTFSLPGLCTGSPCAPAVIRLTPLRRSKVPARTSPPQEPPRTRVRLPPECSTAQPFTRPCAHSFGRGWGPGARGRDCKREQGDVAPAAGTPVMTCRWGVWKGQPGGASQRGPRWRPGCGAACRTESREARRELGPPVPILRLPPRAARICRAQRGWTTAERPWG